MLYRTNILPIRISVGRDNEWVLAGVGRGVNQLQGVVGAIIS